MPSSLSSIVMMLIAPFRALPPYSTDASLFIISILAIELRGIESILKLPLYGLSTGN